MVTYKAPVKKDRGGAGKREKEGGGVRGERKREQLEEAATVKVRHREIPPYPISGSCPPLLSRSFLARRFISPLHQESSKFACYQSSHQEYLLYCRVWWLVRSAAAMGFYPDIGGGGDDNDGGWDCWLFEACWWKSKILVEYYWKSKILGTKGVTAMVGGEGDMLVV